MENSDLGSGRNIPDLQHWFLVWIHQLFFIVTFYMGIFLGLTLLAAGMEKFGFGIREKHPGSAKLVPDLDAFYMGIFLGLTLLASSPAEASDVLWLMWNGTLPATGKPSLPCLGSLGGVWCR
jgi:hypothetical protein